MAIEIIPKTEKEKASYANVFFYFCVAAFLIFLVSYALLYLYQKKLGKELSGIEKNLERTAAEKTLEEEIIQEQKKIRDFGVLLQEHRFVAELFDFLEKFSHPKAWFSGLKMDSEKGTADISGEVDNFEGLGQQVLILKEQEFIKSLNLTKVSTSKEGKIKFDFRLTLDPEIFK